ncbi:MAG TPA: proline iminopeptidase-family hydrolase [Cellvibrio sp.]|nr:proline iminopeptidase-family hydrolase [Cellvibrio sp.]
MPIPLDPRKYLLYFCLCLSLLAYCHSTRANEGFIAVEGGSVWYKRLGSGPQTPLLLIHGGPGGNSCALGSLAQLGQQRPIIFYDQLGAGKSQQPNDLSLWQIHRFVAELESVRRALQLQKVHLLAHSWGAAIAAQYLLDKGSQGIASVIFVGPYLGTPDWITSTTELRRQLAPATQAILQKHEAAGTTASPEYQRASEEFYKLFLYRQPHIDPIECKDSAWSSTIYETMWGNSEFFPSGNLKNFNAAKDLQKIKIPTLFIIGEYDEMQESIVRQYQQRMTNAEVAVIKDAAHMSMVDQPELFLQTVDAFLARQESKAKQTGADTKKGD